MRLKHLIITLLTIALLSVFADTVSAQQNFHFRKGWEYADIDWERSAFSEWERGMSAGEWIMIPLSIINPMQEDNTIFGQWHHGGKNPI